MLHRFALRLFCAPFYRQKVVVGAYREISPDGLYLGYCSFGDMRDVQLMLPFDDKTLIFLTKYLLFSI